MRSIQSYQKLLVTVLAVCLLAMLFAAVGDARAKSVIIVAIGADNVYGRGIGKRNTGGVSPSQAFPAQLEALLHARGVDAHVINAGVGGDNSARMFARLDSAVPEGTRLVILDRPNGNDKKSGLKAEQRSYVHKMKARLRARHIAVIVVPVEKDPGLDRQPRLGRASFHRQRPCHYRKIPAAQGYGATWQVTIEQAMEMNRARRMTCRSVRQRPSALTLTCTSVGPAGSRLIASIDNGAPTSRNTAGRVNMPA